MKGLDFFYTLLQTLHGPLAWQGRLRQHWVGSGEWDFTYEKNQNRERHPDDFVIFASCACV
jgi:hypothetical protein